MPATKQEGLLAAQLDAFREATEGTGGCQSPKRKLWLWCKQRGENDNYSEEALADVCRALRNELPHINTLIRQLQSEGRSNFLIFETVFKDSKHRLTLAPARNVRPPVHRPTAALAKIAELKERNKRFEALREQKHELDRRVNSFSTPPLANKNRRRICHDPFFNSEMEL